MSTIPWPNGGQTFVNIAKDDKTGSVRKIRVTDDVPHAPFREVDYTSAEVRVLADRHDGIAEALRKHADHLDSTPEADVEEPPAPPTE